MSTATVTVPRAHKLTVKQQRFVDEYLVDCHATNAAIRAGYSAKTADTIASNLMKKSWVMEKIQAGQKKKSKKRGLSATWVLKRLVYESKTAVTAAARVKALELVGKHMGMFTDKVELTGRNGGPIEVADISEEERVTRLVVLLQRVQERQIVHSVQAGTSAGALGTDDAGRA